MPELEYSVAMTKKVHDELAEFLLREDLQEDLAFALYTPSQGETRFTALVTDLLFPQEDERELHGNVSFHQKYLERVYSEALVQEKGVVFLHSHLGPGWQGVSKDDIRADTRIALSAVTVTSLPLISMTLGTDRTWSARAWGNDDGTPRMRWCTNVRVVGTQLKTDFADCVRPKPRPTTRQKRTVAVWGQEEQARMTRLTVGIVGLGSVGSQVCEQLARSGFTRLVLIDHDRVEVHNLDRLTGAFLENLDELKVDVAARNAKRSSTAGSVEVRSVPVKLTSTEGYQAALDCDVLFSCVDRPQPRRLLDHLAYAHLIPVIDGGVRVKHKDGAFSTVNWQVQTVGPERPCLECVRSYDPGEADMDAKGLLDDPTYLEGLGSHKDARAGENVYTFSNAVASMEMMHLFALVTGQQNFGVQRFDFRAGVTESNWEAWLNLSCSCKNHLVGTGDTVVDWLSHDLVLEAQRQK